MTSDQDVALASTEADAEAVRAVERHHAELSGALTLLVDALIDQVRRGVADGGGDGDPDLEPARSRLSAFCTEELLPHASAEEVALYPAAASDARARLLVEAMIGEHRTLSHLVDELARTTDPLQAVAVAESVRTLFGSHLAKENDLILPLVAASPDVSLVAVLSGMHELLGDANSRRRRTRTTAPDTAASVRRKAATPAPSSTSGTSRTPSATPPSSAPSARSRAGDLCCWWHRTTRCRCSSCWSSANLGCST